MERELGEQADNKRMDEWVKLQMQIHLPTAERRDLLPAMTARLSQGSPVDANNLLLGCISNSAPVIRPSVRPFGNTGGRTSSAGDLGCQYGNNPMALAMAEVARAWGTHDGQIISRVHSEYVDGDVWGLTTCREFADGDILTLEQRSRCDSEETAPFIDMTCLHRMLVAHIVMVLCCFSIKVIKSCVFKQPKDSGLLGGHWDSPPA